MESLISMATSILLWMFIVGQADSQSRKSSVAPATSKPTQEFLSQRPEDTCKTDTGGTCSVFNCYYWRGPIECSSVQHKCICKPGYCAIDGVCTLQTTELKAKVAPVNKDRRLFPGAQGHVSKAVCFSGGGSRSQTLVMGQLRALEGMNVMESVDALSSVSGGTWASAVYMFANHTLNELLGASTLPSQLSPEVLSRTPPEIGATATQNWILIAVRRLLEGILHGVPLHKLWQYMCGTALLKPFDLDALEAFMAPDLDSARRIQAENPRLNDSKFVIPQLGRPKTFVMNGAILAPVGYVGKQQQVAGGSIVSFQMSPDFTGSPVYPNGSKVAYGGRAELVGGGFVETFAFGGSSPMEPWQEGEAAKIESPTLPFSLVDAVGISSAAPGFELVSRFPYKYIAGFFDPHAQYWPVPSQQFPAPAPAMTYEMADGGDLENSGLLAMIQRGAKRIGWFVNSNEPINVPAEICTLPLTTPSHFDPNGMINDQIYDKFGFGNASKYHRKNAFIEYNQVFASDALIPLLCALKTLVDEGKPAVYKMTQTVLQNSWWGIDGGYTVDLVLVYNNKCADFEAGLPAATQELIGKKGGEFEKFPYYDTGAGGLTAGQVNLLAAQAEYAVRQNAQLFQDLFA